MLKTSGLIGLLTLVLATHADEPALPSAHVHGQATLTVAVEGKALEIHLDSAAMNLPGFEHRANSQAEKRRLTALRKELDDVQQRLQLPQLLAQGRALPVEQLRERSPVYPLPDAQKSV